MFHKYLMRYNSSFIVLNNLNSKSPLLPFELDWHWYLGEKMNENIGVCRCGITYSPHLFYFSYIYSRQGAFYIYVLQNCNTWMELCYILSCICFWTYTWSIVSFCLFPIFFLSLSIVISYLFNWNKSLWNFFWLYWCWN